MENTNKITEKQLETIVNQQKDINALLSNIGLLESQKHGFLHQIAEVNSCLLYTSPSPRDRQKSRMPSSA